MGATLPAVARWMTTSRVGVSRIGFLYTANIIGAVGGTLLAPEAEALVKDAALKLVREVSQ